MPNANLNVRIDADVKPLKAKMAEASAATKDFATQVTNTATVTDAGAQKIAGSFSGLKNVMGGLGSAITGLINPTTILMTGITAAGALAVKAYNEWTASARRLAEEQEAIAKATNKAAGEVGDEIAKVTTLVTVLQSENTTRLQKETALNSLKKINADYFGDLDIEDGKVQNLTASYDAYINRLTRSVTAKANLEILTNLIKQQQELIGRVNQGSVSSGPFTANNLSEYQIQDAIRKFGLSFGRKQGQSSFIDLDKLQIIADLLNLEKRIKDIQKTIAGSIQDVYNPKPENLKLSKGPKGGRIIIKPETIIIDDEGAKVELSSFYKEGAKSDAFGGGAGLVIEREVPIKVHMKAIFDPKDVKKFKDEMAAVITDVLAAIGEGLGKLAAGGGFGAFFKMILNSLGSGLQKLGAQAIAASELILQIKETLGTVSGIAAGIALVALGTLVQAAASQIKTPAFATGVRNFEGGTALVGERGPELLHLPSGSNVIPNGQLNNMMTGNNMLVAEYTIKGQDLRTVLKRADANYLRNS